MLGLLALLFLLVPLAELYVLVQVSHHIGVGTSLVLLVLVSVAGAALAKRAGLGVWRRLQSSLQQGRVPSAEVVEGFLVLLAGALLLTPGFLTDAVALGLLLPPTRMAVRALLLRQIRRGTTRVVGFGVPWPPPAPRRDDVWDVEGWEAAHGRRGAESRRPAARLEPPDGP